jgi:hypothetical protein
MINQIDINIGYAEMKCYELGWFGFLNFKNFFWWKILQK